MNQDLLNGYRSLWKNRQLGETAENSEAILIDAISRELKDENSHPRIRKPPADKLYLAVKRISDSNLNGEMKLELIEKHIEIYESIK